MASAPEISFTVLQPPMPNMQRVTGSIINRFMPSGYPASAASGRTRWAASSAA
jgi:hypothetical protein